MRTSAGVMRLSFLVRSAVLTKYTASTAAYIIRYRYGGNESTIVQATFGIKYG